jgi:hypothetical protein
MYQREPALERAADHLFGFYGRLNGHYRAELADSSRACQKVHEGPALGSEMAGTGR